MATNPLLKGLAPMHPGELLREEILPAVGKPKTEIARLLGVSRQTLYDILGERQPITPAMALRLGKMFGDGPGIWLRMQQNYDLAIAEKRLAKKLGTIPTLHAAE